MGICHQVFKIIRSQLTSRKRPPQKVRTRMLSEVTLTTTKEKKEKATNTQVSMKPTKLRSFKLW